MAEIQLTTAAAIQVKPNRFINKQNETTHANLLNNNKRHGRLFFIFIYLRLNVLATSWEGASHAINMADSKNFAGKVLIDVTNPLDFSKGMPPKLSVGHTDSAGEIVQRLLPDAKVVKAFNIVGNIHMVYLDFPQ